MNINKTDKIDRNQEKLNQFLACEELAISSKDINEHIHTKMDRLTCTTSALSNICCANESGEEKKGNHKKTTAIDNKPEKARADIAKNIHFLHR